MAFLDAGGNVSHRDSGSAREVYLVVWNGKMGTLSNKAGEGVA